ncbi:MAG: C-terminal binding protein [Clostridiales Family XIII bacterium]|jgi:D-3-phosphoglycerate dehydrogenase|nr:C-terminal binding protein [Clostridiales Family XIII bacterium]
MAYKVVLYNTEGVGIDVEEDVLRQAGCYDDFELIRIDGDKDEEFFKEAEDADGVIIVYIEMNRVNLEKLKHCKVLTIHAIGVNNIDLPAAADLGICVGNVPTYCLEEVALHTVTLILDGVRKITQMDEKVRAGQWPDVTGCGKIFSTVGKTYGLVAFGNIPQRVAEMVQTFGMNVIAYDPFAPDAAFKKLGVKRIDSIEELFAQSDFISVHTPLLPTTHHMIGKAQFDAIKPGAIFAVTGRGGVVDEDALKEAIESGKVAFAGLDVLENEVSLTSVSTGSPLMGMEQVIMTPHVAYYSEESLVQCRIDAMKQIIEVLKDKKLPSHLVNKDVAGKARFQIG